MCDKGTLPKTRKKKEGNVVVRKWKHWTDIHVQKGVTLMFKGCDRRKFSRQGTIEPHS